MAILTPQQDAAFELWAAEFPAEVAYWFQRMQQEYGPEDDVEKLVLTFQQREPAAWNELSTAIVAKYTATTADVEREVGRRVLEQGAASTSRAGSVATVGRAAESRERSSSEAAIDSLQAQRDAIYAQARADIEAEAKAAQPRADLAAVQRKNTIDAVVKRLKAEQRRRAAFEFGAPFVQPVESDAELAAFVERLRGNLERLGYTYRARDLPALLVGWMNLAASRGAKYRVDSALINETALYDVIAREVNK